MCWGQYYVFIYLQPVFIKSKSSMKLVVRTPRFFSYSEFLFQIRNRAMNVEVDAYDTL